MARDSAQSRAMPNAHCLYLFCKGSKQEQGEIPDRISSSISIDLALRKRKK